MRELKIKDIKWISVMKPKNGDIETLKSRFPQIHDLVLEDINSPTNRPSHVESFDDQLYMVLHFPNFIEEAKKTISQEIDFILVADTLITVHYRHIPLLDNIWQEFENEKPLREQYGKTPVHLLNYLLRNFFSSSLKELDQIQEKIDAVEEDVFSGHEKETLEDVAILKRSVLDFRGAVKTQHLTLESLVSQGIHMYGERVKPLLTNLISEYLKVWNLLENHKETLDTLYDTNRQLLASKTNESMRVFTILAFITFIPTAVANIYGMNIQNLPFADNINAFWIVLAMMTILTIGVYLLLKWIKLL